MPQIRVNGVALSYIEQGAGAPVVFVHGAWIDLRYWEPQRQVIATQYHFADDLPLGDGSDDP
jgi:hypothetical protein